MTSAFGMQMPGRTFSGNGIGGADYKYSFNGKEDDKSSGWFTQDYGFRNYDYRLGRFFSQDPLFRIYPELTPYQFASNTPIQAIDRDGLEAEGGTTGGSGGGGTGGGTGGSTTAAGNYQSHQTIAPKSNPFSSNRFFERGGGSTTGGSGSGIVIVVALPRNREILPMKSTNAQISYITQNYTSFREAMWAGMANAMGSNFLLGAGRTNPYEVSKDPYIQEAYAKGQIAGDLISMLMGETEVVTGEGMIVGGAAAAPASGGGGLVVSGVGVGVTLHGTTMVGVASGNLIKTAVVLNSIQNNNGNEEGSNSTSSNEKTGVDSKKMTNEEIGEFFDDPNWHQTSAKKDFLKKYLKKLRGSTNADFYLSKSNQILLKGNKPGSPWVETGVYLNK